MRYYKITAKVTDKNWVKESGDREERNERARRIAETIKEFNQKVTDRFIFLSKIECRRVTIGVIARDSGQVYDSVCSFFKTIGIKADDLMISETTLSYVIFLLSIAHHANYIYDYSDILEVYGLNLLERRVGNSRFIETKEVLLDEGEDKTSRYAAAEELMAEETLVPELDRIYSEKMKCSAYGHPVHYYIETDDGETEHAMIKTLLGALYDNGRLRSRRYSIVEVCPWRNLPNTTLDQIYGSGEDGAVVIRYVPTPEDDDSGFASGEMDAIETVCQKVLKYRNRTLTLISLPRSCKKTKKLFTEWLGSIGMVVVRENLADSERAVVYLKKQCRDRHIRYDKNLAGRLDGEKQYLPDELRAIFEEWYNEKMRTKIFPQYKDIAVSREETAKEVAQGPAIDDLNEMIGLRAAKDVIMKALSYYKLQRMYSDRGITQDRPAMHMAFMGNPGTAKTTVARLFARIMKENGLLSKGHLVEVGRSDLVGKYLGWTAPTVKKKFDQAMGGVLFIDEAYSLAEAKDGLYGDEAINTIVQEMENRREDLIVIFAGYPQEMEEFLSKNPGLRSRIAFHVPFADYDSDELCGIARMIAESKGVTLTDGAVAKLSVLFDSVRCQPDFGNGRYVRNVIELSKLNQASRILALNPTDITDRVLTSIEADDIEIPTIRSATQKRTIGFAS